MITANKDIAARVEKLEHRQGQISSIIEVLVNEIEHMKVLPPPNKRKIGFDLRSAPHSHESSNSLGSSL